MREYIFRGRRKDNGEWVEGSLIISSKHYFISTGRIRVKGLISCEKVCFEIFEVLPETIGQYTGLRDKNGKRIFEGDIVRKLSNYTGKNMNNPVNFELGCFWLKYDDDSGCPLGDICDKIEVISNIHDNPELMKEMKEA